MKIFSIICELYTEFYIQVSLNRNFKYNPSHSGMKSDHLIICRFIKFLKQDYNQQADINFLVDFFKFQFSHYVGIKTSYGTNAIMLHWIIGPKAIERWKQRDVRKKWIVRVKLKNDVELKLLTTYKKINQKDEKQVFLLIHKHEERDKAKHHNTNKGLNYCAFTTTLFNPKSTFCTSCIFKENCKILLSKNHPKLHKLRIDE